MSNYDKLKKKELADLLKARGLSQVGDMGTQVHRLKLHDAAVEFDMKHEGTNVCELKMGPLKKYAARSGVNPMGTQDEILTELVELLKKKGKPSSSSSSSSSSTSSGQGVENLRTGGESVDPVALARRVLELDQVDDYEAILNIATTKDTRVTRHSPAAAMRKAYLKLSLLIHPDKLGRVFDQATKAFQALVRAFERLSSPDLASEDKKFAGKAQQDVMSISRSNEGCHRTRICCPRCKQPWSEGGVDGNPDYFYNFLMTGLKQYTCSTCLCEFGCMTAIHKCPHCRKPFEYSPSDYHRKIQCGNAKCEKKFGFYLYHVSDRTIKEIKQTVREEQEAIIKNRESKLRRANRGAARNTNTISLAEEEQAFTLGLTDCCPRCGEEFEEYSEELQRQHLVECMDDKKHAEFRSRREAQRKAKEAKNEKLDRQASAQSKAVWDLLGGNSSQLYLLDEAQLRAQAEVKGLDIEPGLSKEEMIAALARKENGTLLTDGGSSSSSGRKRIRPQDLPPSYQNFSLSQLKALCASFGFVPATESKAEIIKLIEADIYAYEESTGRTGQPHMLEAGTAAAPLMILGDEEDMFDPKKSKQQQQKKRKILTVDEDSASDSDAGSEYRGDEEEGWLNSAL